MPCVEFYEIKGPRWELVLCRVVEIAYGRGLKVYVWAESEQDARRLDDLLWTFRDDSFLPHGLWQGGPDLDEPVAVGWKPGNPNGATCLVLARDAAPDEVRGYEQILDLAPVDVPLLRHARTPGSAFGHFRQRGCRSPFTLQAPT
jgi:DNA polymerase-3 subunit chi